MGSLDMYCTVLVIVFALLAYTVGSAQSEMGLPIPLDWHLHLFCERN